jgi:hypothetical protein
VVVSLGQLTPREKGVYRVSRLDASEKLQSYDNEGEFFGRDGCGLRLRGA